MYKRRIIIGMIVSACILFVTINLINNNKNITPKDLYTSNTDVEKELVNLDDIRNSVDDVKNDIESGVYSNLSGEDVSVYIADGSVKVDGKMIGKDVDFPQNVGIIIETPGFIPYYSGYRNLKILAGLRKKINDDEIKETLKTVGLEGAEKKLVRKYSLGMRQRLGLAQAMMEKPDIFILDEPMNGLDNEDVEEMRKILLNLKEEGKTILLVSHNSEDIKILCDEYYYIDKGKLECA